MRKYVLGSVVLIALGVFVANGFAQTSSGARRMARANSQTLSLTGRVREVLLSTTCKDIVRVRPLPCQMVFLGIQKDAQGGRQLLYAVDNFMGRPSRDVYTYRATNEAYDANGSLRTRYTGKHTVRQNGKTCDVGQGPFTGGTGAYRGITGTLTYSGCNPNNAKVLVYPWRAKVTIP